MDSRRDYTLPYNNVQINLILPETRVTITAMLVYLYSNFCSELQKMHALCNRRRIIATDIAGLLPYTATQPLQQDVPAHKALHCHVDLSLGWPPNDQWKRRPGRPRERWTDQVQKDNGIPPADLWRRATSRGHRAAMLRPPLATR